MHPPSKHAPDTATYAQPCSDSRKAEVLVAEMRLHNASGLDPRSQHVLLRGDVVRSAQPLQRAQVAGGRTSRHGSENADEVIAPEDVHVCVQS